MAQDFTDFSGKDGKPTEAERRLIEATRTGEIALCSDIEEVREKIVSAALIRALATGEFHGQEWPDWELVSDGVFLIGAIMHDKVIVSHRRVPAALRFSDCSFENGVDLSDSNFTGNVFFRGCEIAGAFKISNARILGQFSANNTTFRNSGDIAINAQSVESASWFMNEADVDGELWIAGANIRGQFSAINARFNNPKFRAIGAQSLKATDFSLDGSEIRGIFDINSADIDGQIVANGASFMNAGQTSVEAHSVKATGWYMNTAKIEGEFDISAGRILGNFSANGTQFKNSGARALRAQNVVATDWSMHDAELDGEFDITSAIISGPIAAASTKFRNANGCAVRAQGAKIGGLFLNDAEFYGEFDINNAELFAPFNAVNGKFKNPRGTAISAYNTRFLGGLLLKGDNAIAHGDVDLSGSHIHSGINLSQANFIAGRHRAIRLSDTEVLASVICEGTHFLGHFEASRTRFHGQVSFRGSRLIAATRARETGELDEKLAGTFNKADEARQHRFRHHALVLREALFDGRLILPETCPEGIVDLSRARCDTLEDLVAGWQPPLVAGAPACDDRVCVTEDGNQMDIQHIVLDGFECKHFEHPDGTESPYGDNVGAARIAWLAGQPAGDLRTHFNPQPWRMTAAVLRAMGYEKAGDRISIERRTRQRLSEGTPRRARLLGWLLHHAADYGYNPLKAVLWSATIVVACALLYWGGAALCTEGRCGQREAFLEARHGDIDKDVAYPEFQPLLYSLDLFVPILDFNSESFWRADTEASATLDPPILKLGFGPLVVWQTLPIGWILHLLAIAERVVGAIMVAIAIVGFTGIVKREER